MELVALSMDLTEREDQLRSGRATTKAAAVWEETAADATCAPKAAIQDVLVAALVALKRQSRVIPPETEELQRQVAALQGTSQQNQDQLVTE